MNLTSSAPITALQSSLRAAVAAGSAVAMAKLLQLEYPVYALISAVLVLDLSPLRTRQLAVQRLLGSLLGAIVGAILSYPLPTGPLAIGVSILIAMLLSYGLRMPDAAKVAGYVSGIGVERRPRPAAGDRLDVALAPALGLLRHRQQPRHLRPLSSQRLPQLDERHAHFAGAA